MDVYAIVRQPREIVRWRSAVYLRVDGIEQGDENGLGKSTKLHTKGLLPHTLDSQAKVIEVDKPAGLVIAS